MAEAMKHNMLSFKEISLLKVAIEIETTGKLPSSMQAKAILRLEKRLDDAGVCKLVNYWKYVYRIKFIVFR